MGKISRRTFGKGLAALAFGAVFGESAGAQEDQSEDQPKIEFVKSVEEIISIVEQSIEQRNALLEKPLTMLETIEKKYGNSDKPLVYIRNDFVYKPADISPLFCNVPKDEKHKQILLELVEHVTTLRHLGITTEVTQQLEDRLNRMGLRTLLDPEKKLSAVDLVYALAKKEIMDFYDSKFWYTDHTRLAKATERAAPHLEMSVTDHEIGLEVLNPIFSDVLVGYPDRWPTWQYLLNEEYSNRLKRIKSTPDTIVEGFHDPASDELVLGGPKSLQRLILTIAHEAGHVVAPIGEAKLHEMLEREVNKTKFLERLHTEYKQLIGDAHDGKFKEAVQSKREIDRRFMIYNMGQQFLDTMSELRLESDKIFGESIGYGPEEASAYLFQGIIINELAKRDPHLGSVLWHRR